MCGAKKFCSKKNRKFANAHLLLTSIRNVISLLHSYRYKLTILVLNIWKYSHVRIRASTYKNLKTGLDFMW